MPFQAAFHIFFMINVGYVVWTATKRLYFEKCAQLRVRSRREQVLLRFQVVLLFKKLKL